MTAAEQTEDKKPRSIQSFNGMTWHQKGSETRHTDIREVFSLSHSPGHLVLLTFCLANTKRDRLPKPILSWLCVPQVRGWHKWSWQMALQIAGFFLYCICEHVWAGNSERSFFLSATVERQLSTVHHLVTH